MTETVRHMLQQGDEIEFIEELVKAMYDFQPDDTQCLEKWLRKLQSDHKAEMENP